LLKKEKLSLRKRAFSVSGSFRKALTDLITDMRNSNKPLVQATLFGEIIPEEKYILLGFVDGEDLQIESVKWYIMLNSKQLDLLDDCLKEKLVFLSIRPYAALAPFL
jgi:hypothetical protein